MRRLAPSILLLPSFVGFFLAMPMAHTAEADLSEIRIIVEKTGSFELVDARLGSRSGVLSALPGGHAMELIFREQGDERREPGLHDESTEADMCRNHFLEAFIHELAEHAVTASVIESKATSEALEQPTVQIRIVSCGYRKFRAESELLRPYFLAEYRFAQTDEQSDKEYRQLFITGSSNSRWDEYAENIELTIRLFREQKERAGRRLAVRLLYDVM